MYSSNFFDDVIGSMYHRDAHDGPGGLYHDGLNEIDSGQLADAFNAFDSYMSANYGVSGMDALNARHPFNDGLPWQYDYGANGELVFSPEYQLLMASSPGIDWAGVADDLFTIIAMSNPFTLGFALGEWYLQDQGIIDNPGIL